MKFSRRDSFLLTVIVALAVGWGLDRFLHSQGVVVATKFYGPYAAMVVLGLGIMLIRKLSMPQAPIPNPPKN